MCHASRLEQCVSRIWDRAVCVTHLGQSTVCHASGLEQHVSHG